MMIVIAPTVIGKRFTPYSANGLTDLIVKHLQQVSKLHVLDGLELTVVTWLGRS